MSTIILPLESVTTKQLDALRGDQYTMGMVDGLTVKKNAGIVVPAIFTDQLYNALGELGNTRAQELLCSPAYDSAWAEVSERSDIVAMSYAIDTEYHPPAPPGCQYHPFQRAGIEYAASIPGALIGDEPGLGKTVQAIGVANVNQHKKIVVVCPLTVKYHWQKLMAKWLTYTVAHITPIDAKTPQDLLKSQGVIILNYDILDRVEPSLKKVDFLILDESHYIRNADSKRSRAAGRLATKSSQVLLLSGTPIENKPKDLYRQVKLAAPWVFNNSTHFYMKYCNPVFNFNTKQYDYNGVSNAEDLSVLLRSTVMVRRKKKDVLKDLPDKQRITITVRPTKTSADKKLQTLLTHTLSQFNDVDAGLAHIQAKQGNQYATVRQQEGLDKVPYCIEFIEDQLESEDKLVVFYYHRAVGDAFAKAFKNTLVRIQGGDKDSERQTAIQTFIRNPDCRIIAISIMAGGTGLDGLQEVCSTAIFCELPHNSSNITQAEDRLHRIGQKSAINVFHVLMEGSFDFIAAERLIEKQQNSDLALQ